MATIKPPINEQSPMCKCGCGEYVNWMPGKGWARWVKGHSNRGRSGNNRGKKFSKETRKKMSEAAKLREYRRREAKGTSHFVNTTDPNPDRAALYKELGLSVYTTYEFKEARKRLVEGKPCVICGTYENIHAHHVIPGDDETLIPVCGVHHPMLHAEPDSCGQEPPPGEEPPLCACGCEKPVRWKRHRGWANFRKGHGSAIVAAGTRHEEPPLCKCGCGETVKFQYGHGWNEYKTGHRQRVEGAHHNRPHPPAPDCKCGCGEKVAWKKSSGYPKYIPGHRKSDKGRFPPEGEQAPLCRCGCGESVGWVWGHGWSKWKRNHDKRKVSVA